MTSPAKTLKAHPVGTVLAVLLIGTMLAFAACSESLVGTDEGAGAVTEKSPQEEAFVIVEEMPVLIGGLEGIRAKIKYPELARKAGIEGRVYLQFVVNTDGVPEEIVVVRGLGAGTDEEAVRALKASRFEPGKQGGRTVPVKMSIPVTFRLTDKVPPKGAVIDAGS